MRLQDQLSLVERLGASVSQAPFEIMEGSVERTMQQENIVVEKLNPIRALTMKAAGISNAAICEALYLTAGQLSMCLKILKLSKMRKALGESDENYIKRFCKALRDKGYLPIAIAQLMRLSLDEVQSYLN